jgi:hypothetical protein
VRVGAVGLALALAAASRPAAADDDTHACIVASDEAQRLRDESKLTAARDHFLRCARDACPDPIRKDCSEWLDDVERRLPRVVFEARDAAGTDLVHVRAFVDGVVVAEALDGRAVAIDPGVHRFRFEVGESAPVEEVVVVREGEKEKHVRAVFYPAPAPAKARAPAASEAGPGTGPPVLALTLAGVGVAALGGFAYFGLTGQSDKNDLEDGCAPTRTCDLDDVARARDRLIVADVLLGVGIVALGAATVVFFATTGKKASQVSSRRIQTAPRWSF